MPCAKNVLLGLALVGGADAFLTSSPAVLKGPSPSLRQSTVSTCAVSGLSMAESPSRREALGSFSAAALGLLFSSQEANAAGKALGYANPDLKDINAALSSYSLAPKAKVTDGFRPLMELVGGTVGANIDGSKTVESIGSKINAAPGQKVLLLFDYPSSWIVSLPIATANGESGTVSANNYVKGDSAAVAAKAIADGSLADQSKEFFQDLMTQQVPSDQWQNFKLVKKSTAEPVEGQETVDIEYRYDLITSGPIIGRHGFAKVVKVGKNALALGATTADTRFKKMKDELVLAKNSFRAHLVQAEFTK